MWQIKLAKAQTLHSVKHGLEEVSILIDEEIPEFPAFEDAENFYNKQSDLLADALMRSLPQGTLDRLHIKLMEKRVSIYRGLTRS